MVFKEQFSDLRGAQQPRALRNLTVFLIGAGELEVSLDAPRLQLSNEAIEIGCYCGR